MTLQVRQHIPCLDGSLRRCGEFVRAATWHFRAPLIAMKKFAEDPKPCAPHRRRAGRAYACPALLACFEPTVAFLRNRARASVICPEGPSRDRAVVEFG